MNAHGMPAGTAVTAKQARLKKEEAEKCTEENSAACYDHTGNIGIGPVKVPEPFLDFQKPSLHTGRAWGAMLFQLMQAWPYIF